MQRTPMRAMSPKREAEFAAMGKFPHSTLDRPEKPEPKKATARKVVRLTGPDKDTVDAALARDENACVVCGLPNRGERGVDWSIHHRVRRSQGGTNDTSNLITVCGSGTQGCHGEIHSHVADSRDNGWLLKSSDNSMERPVLTDHRSRWLYLTSDGEYSDVPPVVAA